MRFYTLLYLVFTLTFSLSANNHPDYTSYDLRAPLDIPLLLSGNFAELRSHHFHAGIDFKTQGKTGFPIIAVADGYVSRISVSPAGYGFALYLDHPELELTTLYGHLSAYAPKIDRLVKARHYEIEKYNLNYFPDERIYVKKGDTIAYSGNSGSSGGPHLHFETRQRSNQAPINPLLFGFDVKDTMKPSINGLRIYPIEGKGVLNQEQYKDSKFYPIVYYSGEYHIKGNPTIEAWGKLGFAISTIDYLDGSWSKCGIYSIELFADSQLIFQQEMDQISYSEMRYIDAHLDQAVRKKSRTDYQYTFLAKPNNPLSIYKSNKNKGLLNITSEKKYQVKYLVKDSYGNTSALNFNIKGKASNIPTVKDSSLVLNWQEAYRYSTPQFQLYIPAKAMYENQSISYEVTNDSNYLAPVIEVDNQHKLLNKKATLSLRPYPNSTIPLEKMVMCKVQAKGNLEFLPSEMDQGSLKAKVYSFSRFTISADTIAPSITPYNIKSGKRFSSPATFGFKVKDDFTGLWDYKGSIDGHWALFLFDAKKNYVYYTIDPQRLEKGKTHHLEFEVWDACNNISSYTTDFYW